MIRILIVYIIKIMCLILTEAGLYDFIINFALKYNSKTTSSPNVVIKRAEDRRKLTRPPAEFYSKNFYVVVRAPATSLACATSWKKKPIVAPDARKLHDAYVFCFVVKKSDGRLPIRRTRRTRNIFQTVRTKQ